MILRLPQFRVEGSHVFHNVFQRLPASSNVFQWTPSDSMHSGVWAPGLATILCSSATYFGALSVWLDVVSVDLPVEPRMSPVDLPSSSHCRMSSSSWAVTWCFGAGGFLVPRLEAFMALINFMAAKCSRQRRQSTKASCSYKIHLEHDCVSVCVAAC